MPGTKARDAADSPYGKPDEAQTALAGLLEEHLAPHAEIVDWQMKDDVQREMRKVIKKHLRAAAYPAERVDSLAEGIVDLLKRRRPA
jgi:type I restriction enzyme R subunit